MKSLQSIRSNIPIGERSILVDLFTDVLDPCGGFQYSRGAGTEVAEHVIAFFLVENVLHFEIAMTNRSLTMMQTRNRHANVAENIQHLILRETGEEREERVVVWRRGWYGRGGGVEEVVVWRTGWYRRGDGVVQM